MTEYAEPHRETSGPSWDTKVRCSCGAEFVSRAEQWNHASDSLRDAIETLTRWKAEALVVLGEWDACFDLVEPAYPARIGASRARHVAHVIETLTAQLSDEHDISQELGREVVELTEPHVTSDLQALVTGILLGSVAKMLNVTVEIPDDDENGIHRPWFDVIGRESGTKVRITAVTVEERTA